MLRECEGDSNDGMGDEGCVVVVSSVHEYVGGTRGSDILSFKVQYPNKHKLINTMSMCK